MIIDKFDNIRFYSCMLNNLENGLQAVEALRNPESGKYEFDGGFFMVQKGDTKPMAEGTFEAHRKYVDVQIVLEGSEEIAWADLEDLREEGEYDGDKDKAAYTGSEENTMKITAGMCYIAFPHDGHKAVRHTAEQQSYTKIVMKLPVVK
ncbi:YhcH/YjgK/YiaL family protein [[Clostridium] symbiosum]|uniref:YhcH/YjgK/YiaL family protein n=1 Tax=Clostridium symbiosum TaxID=1512 RepID=UPI001D07A9DD|nr:YhcH/YjgK/YiaL family protein [[Clostridium] symbiosum]MCB6609269.1 YhcH/YjgK/YiaL family protein [[Clostridium] symbiosum]MCB6932767.1 YhcH/YjgK/YiaL family protein [[Clostridium] symbiosum]